MEPGEIDLGSGFSYRFYSRDPDRELNPQYEGMESVDKAGIILRCPHSTGSVNFDIGVMGQVAPERNYWTLVSLEPLTIDPSIQCYMPDAETKCCHGYIREGAWVYA